MHDYNIHESYNVYTNLELLIFFLFHSIIPLYLIERSSVYIFYIKPMQD